jgi:hypothetical protein
MGALRVGYGMKDHQLVPKRAELAGLPSLTAMALALTTVAVSLSGCIMPGQKPALGNASAALGSCGPEGLVDDGEDNNNQGAVVDGRGGYWYTYADDSTAVVPEAGERNGTFTMSPGGANSSRFAANAHGQIGHGSVLFGGLGVSLLDPKTPYDASQYGGIAFWARKGAGTVGKIRLKVPDVNTDDEGAICKECFNAFGADITITESWQRFVIPFKKMRQEEGWGSPRPRSIAKNKLYGIQWQAAQPGANFDIWIDDVEFVGCE